MDSALDLRRWSLRGIFAMIVAVVLITALLPLRVEAPRFPGPDLVLCVTLAWVLRRPDVLPVLFVVAAVLLEDFLFQRPPGLWALLVLAGSEVIRRQAYREGEIPFLLEYGMVAGTITAMMVAERVLLAVAFVPQPSLGAHLLHLATTLAIYPLVVAVSVFVLGVSPLTTDGPRIRGMRQ